MSKRKSVFYIIGGNFAFSALLGLMMVFLPKGLTVAAATVIICLSIASGLIIPNHISLLGLVAGICMLVFPAWIVGIVFIVIGNVGALINMFASRKFV